MATTPPTAAEVDAWAQDNVIPQMISQAVGATPGHPITFCVFGYTQNDGTPAFQYTYGLLPTEDPNTATLASGLTAQYGQVTIRAYRFTFDMPAPAAADIAVPAAELETISTPSNWDTP